MEKTPSAYSKAWRATKPLDPLPASPFTPTARKTIPLAHPDFFSPEATQS